ncbi:hypothetical protein KM043_009110 [Ampulex compressa]|nr:hypothetical protein KM043_009110 [Ampulex compressa]
MQDDDLEPYDEFEGEEDYESPASSSTLKDETCVLTRLEAGKCLHTLGRCGSGIGYAYLGLDASNRSLTDVGVIPTFIHVIYVNVSGNRLTSEALQVLTRMTYLLMLQADRNLVTSAELKPMPYLQVLTLNNNKLTSTEGITHNLLECLELNKNEIYEVNLDPNILKNLKTLELRGNLLTSTTGIFIPGLIRLYLADNRIERIEGFETLVNLKILHLRSNNLSNLSGFHSRCAKLNYLNLRDNEIEKISELEKLRCLSNLETLIVLHNPATEEREDEEISYRRTILAILPKLKRIDKDPVHFDEREEAIQFRQWMDKDGLRFTDLDIQNVR